MRQVEELIQVSQTLEFDKLKVNSGNDKCVHDLCDYLEIEVNVCACASVLTRPSRSSLRLDIWRRRESSRKCPKEELSST